MIWCQVRARIARSLPVRPRGARGLGLAVALALALGLGPGMLRCAEAAAPSGGQALAPPTGEAPAALRWGRAAGPQALRVAFSGGAAIEGTGEAGLVHLIEHLRAGAPRGALPARAWTEHDGWSLGLSVEAGAEGEGTAAMLAPLGGPVAPAKLAYERAVIVEEARAQAAEHRLALALRRAALGPAHPYARPAIGAPEAPSADLMEASVGALLALEARSLAAPRLLLSVGPGAAPAGPLGPPSLPALPSAQVEPGPARALPWGRGGWWVWPGPAAAEADALGLRALALALRRQGRAAQAWAGRSGGYFALAVDRRAARRPGAGLWRGLLGRARPVSLDEDDIQRAKLEQARVAARPDLLAAQAAACWLHGRALACGWEDAALERWGPAALRGVAARWLGAAGAP